MRINTHCSDDPRNRGAEAVFILLIVLAHLAFLDLMVNGSPRPLMTDSRSSPTIATWNILASSEAPPARLDPDPKASTVQVDVDAPTIAVEETAPIASGLGAAFASDPYAGAAPVGDGFAQPVNAPNPQHMRPKPVALAGDDSFSRWVAALRDNLKPVLTNRIAPLKPIRAEVLADSTGGFSNARIVEGSGDLEIDRDILVDLMRHKELVDAGMVGQPKWLALPAIDLTAT